MKVGKLVLDSLHIQGFRAFRDLKVEKLGRVNLIVGKNNVGKSSLLEALHLYANRGGPTIVWEILSAHGEGSIYRFQTKSPKDFGLILSSLRYLFYGRNDIKPKPQPVQIQIGPVGTPDEVMSLSISYLVPKTNNQSSEVAQQALFEEDDTKRLIPRLRVRLGEQISAIYHLDPRFAPTTRDDFLQPINSIFITSDGLTKRVIGELWDNISLTARETEVLDALRIIAPGVEGMNIVGDFEGGRERIAIVKVAGESEPIPIRSLGDGMQRMLGIALALVNAENGILLIDEIENGLHYSIQTDLWRLIFQLAHRLNVQVFATSHSWDCIESFQRAAQEDEQEGILIRLESKKGEIAATVFDENKLAIATQEQIEVR
jgi:ABC-type ATPase involved in cell division